MKITYSETLRQSSDLLALAQQADRYLEEEVSRYLLPITAEWDRTVDEQGRPVVVLRLADRVETGTIQFSEAELKDATTMEWRLSRFWRDWRQENRHKRLEALFKSINDTIGWEDARQNAQ